MESRQRPAYPSAGSDRPMATASTSRCRSHQRGQSPGFSHLHQTRSASRRSTCSEEHPHARHTSRGQCCATYLHVHQSAVLSGPSSLQNLKDGHCAAIHDVHLAPANREPRQAKLRLQQLLLRPLGVIVGIVLKGSISDYPNSTAQTCF